MVNKVQLITYLNRFGGGTISEFQLFFDQYLLKVFGGGLHLLPFYNPIDGVDAGYDPIDHSSVDPRLGSWVDIANIGAKSQIMADIIVNHMSAESSEFLDVRKLGKSSPQFDLFLTKEKIFGTDLGKDDINKIYRPRPTSPFTEIKLGDGSIVNFWTTFTTNQIDIDVSNALGKKYLEDILLTFSKNKIGLIRLDAAGYAIKKAGTNCFMLPETYDFIKEFSDKAKNLGMKVLVEIHSHYLQQIKIARQVDYVYDFALPPLVLHSFQKGSAKQLKKWLEISPRNCITVLDTHDGIGIIDAAGDDDNPGLLDKMEISALVEYIHTNSGGASREASGEGGSNLDIYQINCSYYEAMGKNDHNYLMARAIQFFSPGMPQVYYGGFLALDNDLNLMRKSETYRDINRPYLTFEQIVSNLNKPVVKELIKLIQFRNDHTSFNGEMVVIESEENILNLKWQLNDSWSMLEADLKEPSMKITFGSGKTKEQLQFQI